MHCVPIITIIETFSSIGRIRCLLMRNRKYCSMVWILRCVPTMFKCVSPRVKILLCYYASTRRKLLFSVFFVIKLLLQVYYSYKIINIMNIIILSLFDDNLMPLSFYKRLAGKWFVRDKT